MEPSHPSRSTGARNVQRSILVQIERVERVWAPGHRLFPDRSVEEGMRNAHTLYRVQPSGGTVAPEALLRAKGAGRRSTGGDAFVSPMGSGEDA